MRRSMMIIISSIMITMMASACAPRQHDFEAVFRERLVSHYAEDDKAARAMNGEPLRLDLTFVDLDGDGQPEAVVRLDHPAFCGSRGCAIDIVGFQPHSVVTLLGFIAHKVSTCAAASTGTFCLSIDGLGWTFTNGHLRRKSSLYRPISPRLWRDTIQVMPSQQR